MKQLIISLSAVVLFAAVGCKKNCDDTPEEQLGKTYLSTKEGSWWAYAIYNHDRFGEVTLWKRDTLRVLGDTVIDGNTFAYYEGSLLFPYNSIPGRFGLRDSAFNLIDNRSHLILPYLNFTDTFDLDTSSSALTRFKKLYQDLEPTQVPSGIYETIDYQWITQFQDSTRCGTYSGIFHQQFAENVGVIRATYWYSATFGCDSYTERVLESFHIEE